MGVRERGSPPFRDVKIQGHGWSIGQRRIAPLGARRTSPMTRLKSAAGPGRDRVSTEERAYIASGDASMPCETAVIARAVMRQVIAV
jgi:hypothetical protein